MKSETINEPNHIKLYQYSRYIGNSSGQPLKLKANINGQTFFMYSRMNANGMFGVVSADTNNRHADIFATIGSGLLAEASLDNNNVISIYFYNSDHTLMNVWSNIIVLSDAPSEIG